MHTDTITNHSDLERVSWFITWHDLEYCSKCNDGLISVPSNYDAALGLGSGEDSQRLLLNATFLA